MGTMAVGGKPRRCWSN